MKTVAWAWITLCFLGLVAGAPVAVWSFWVAFVMILLLASYGKE